MKVMIDPAVVDHRKLKRLAANLHVGVVTALGYVVHGWCRTMDQAPRGVLKGWTEDEVTQAFGYKGDPKRFIKALIDAGWLEKNRDGFTIHEWPEHQGDGLAKREEWREKKRKQRAKKKGVPGDKKDSPPPPSPPPPSPSHTDPPVTDPPGNGGPGTPPPAPIDTGEQMILAAMKTREVAGTGTQKREYIQTWRARGYKAGNIEQIILQKENAGAHIWDLDKLSFPFKGGGNPRGLVRDIACPRCEKKGLIKQVIGGLAERIVNCPDCGGTGWKKGEPSA